MYTELTVPKLQYSRVEHGVVITTSGYSVLLETAWAHWMHGFQCLLPWEKEYVSKALLFILEEYYQKYRELPDQYTVAAFDSDIFTRSVNDNNFDDSKTDVFDMIMCNAKLICKVGEKYFSEKIVKNIATEEDIDEFIKL